MPAQMLPDSSDDARARRHWQLAFISGALPFVSVAVGSWFAAKELLRWRSLGIVGRRWAVGLVLLVAIDVSATTALLIRGPPARVATGPAPSQLAPAGYAPLRRERARVLATTHLEGLAVTGGVLLLAVASVSVLARRRGARVRPLWNVYVLVLAAFLARDVALVAGALVLDIETDLHVVGTLVQALTLLCGGLVLGRTTQLAEPGGGHFRLLGGGFLFLVANRVRLTFLIEAMKLPTSLFLPALSVAGFASPAGRSAVVSVLLAPIAEELVFRGILLRWLRTFAGNIESLLICSSIFALLHLPQGAMMLIIFGNALVYGWAYLHSTRLRVPIALHAISNGVELSFSVLRG